MIHRKELLTFHYTGCLKKDPYNGLLQSPYNSCHNPLYTLNNWVFFHCHKSTGKSRSGWKACITGPDRWCACTTRKVLEKRLELVTTMGPQNLHVYRFFMVNNLVNLYFSWFWGVMEVTESSPTFGREIIQELRFEALQKFHPNLLPNDPFWVVWWWWSWYNPEKYHQN